VVLTGEPGVGKTCVLRALRKRLASDVFRLTYCHNATLGRRDFYRQLCLALGLTPSATAASVFYAVGTHVEELGRERVHPIFLLDEAHLLHQDVLDHLHILLNYQWDSRALLSLVLVGLPEIETQLERRRNRSLYSRIHHRFCIDDLSHDDTEEYIRHRLLHAGSDKTLFDHEAIALIHDNSMGALRDVDRIAHAALRDAYRRKKKAVEPDAVERVLAGKVPIA
jgi:type II secretory pathway predicted ATPase ExeA